MPTNSINTQNKARLSSFNRTRELNYGPLLSEFITPLVKPNRKYGYEIHPTNSPILTFDDIKQIKNNLRILYGVEKIKGNNLLAIETAIEEVLDKLETTHSIYSLDSIDHNLFHISSLENTPGFVIQKTHESEFPGAFFYSDIKLNKYKDIIEIGFLIMERLLRVTMWYQISNDMHISYLESVAMDTEGLFSDSNTTPVENWKLSEQSIYTNEGYMFDIPDIVKAYNEQEEMGNIICKRFNDLWNESLINKIKKALKEDCLASAWLKAILYLVINEFDLHHYRKYTDDSYELIPLEAQYCIYYNYDVWFRYIDSYDSEATPEELSINKIITADKIISLNPKKDHERLISIFNTIFSFNIEKDNYHEDPKYSIHTIFNYLSIQQWESVLRRRIKYSRKRRLVYK